MSQTVKPGQPQRGFLVIVWLVTLAGIIAMTASGLIRSLGEFGTSRRYATEHQAFQAAEGGVEIAMYEEQQNNWTWQTHDLAGVKQSPAPPSNFANGSFAASGNYVVPLINGTQISLRVSPGPNGSFLITSTGAGPTGSSSTKIISAAMQPASGLTQFFLFSDGNTSFTVGQLAIYDMTAARIYINGYMEMNTGGTWSTKRKEFKINDLMVNGEMFESDGSGGMSFFIPGSTSKNIVPFSHQQATTVAPYPETGGAGSVKFSSWTGGTLRADGSHDPASAVSANPNWVTQFLKQPVSGSTGYGGLDLSGRIHERFTGAQSRDQVMPGLAADIDTYVLSFKPKADKLVTAPTDFTGCPMGTATDKTFANAMTLQTRTVMQIDVNLLQQCITVPKILYVEAPVRLVNGTTLTKDLTVVSPDAIYVKGNFNYDPNNLSYVPKSAAVITGNRSYHLSSNFTDYSRTIPEANPAVTVAAYNGLWPSALQTDYNAFNTQYNSAITLPPWPQWLPNYATDTWQDLTVVSPLQPLQHDRLVNVKYGYMEQYAQGGFGWPRPGTLTGRKQVHMTGSFVHLKDNDSTKCTTYTNLGYNSGPTPPQDERGSVALNRIFIEPEFYFKYDQNMQATPPPGISGGGSAGGKVTYWNSN